MLFTEASDKYLVIFGKVIKKAIPSHESSNLFTILLKNYSEALSDNGNGLFWLNTSFFKNDWFSHAAAHEWIFNFWAEQYLTVVFIIPSKIIYKGRL